MAKFSNYIPLLSNVEGYGKYTNKPTDKGGPTMSGVTLKTYRSYYGNHKTVEDLKAMTYDQWAYIMKSGYWDKVAADRIDNQSIAELLADFAVNSGPATAVKKVQELVGTKADGIAGPITVKAINTSSPELLFNALLAVRQFYYYKIVVDNPSQKDNLKGWLNRLKQFNYDKQI